VLLDVLEGVAQLLFGQRQLVVGLAVHEDVAIAIAVQVLHRHALDPDPLKAVLVPELLLDDGPAAKVLELGPEEGVTPAQLPRLVLENDVGLALPFDGHAVTELVGTNHGCCEAASEATAMIA